MLLSFAPMEGITSRLYRQCHAERFGGVAEYFAPFIAPDGSSKFKASALRRWPVFVLVDCHLIMRRPQEKTRL